MFILNKLINIIKIKYIRINLFYILSMEGENNKGYYRENKDRNSTYKQNSNGGYQQKGYNNYNKSYNNNNYKKNYNNNNNYQNTQYYDPYTQQMMIYRAEMYILTKYPSLVDVNKRNENLSKQLSSSDQFFVIKSFSEEDVHKSIKYSVWSSTKNGNQTLNNAYNLTKEQNGSVYLLFSTNGSGRYVGIARMKSPVDESKQFMYWTQDSKWPGLFEIEWLFIKDVPFNNFKHILITMKDGEVKPVSNSRDTQEVPSSEGIQMVQIIESFLNTNTVLEYFEYYDMRQENYDKSYSQQI
jgi:hypothetical protein